MTSRSICREGYTTHHNDISFHLPWRLNNTSQWFLVPFAVKVPQPITMYETADWLPRSSKYDTNVNCPGHECALAFRPAYRSTKDNISEISGAYLCHQLNVIVTEVLLPHSNVSLIYRHADPLINKWLNIFKIHNLKFIIEFYPIRLMNNSLCFT